MGENNLAIELFDSYLLKDKGDFHFSRKSSGKRSCSDSLLRRTNNELQVIVDTVIIA